MTRLLPLGAIVDVLTVGTPVTACATLALAVPVAS